MTSLKNKVALITGASRGIGKAIALRYARLGADIVVNYASNTAAADEVLKEIESYQVRGISVKADVSRPEEIDRMFEYVVKEFGKIDIVVVNAGLELVGVPVTEFSEAQFDHLFNTNTKGAFFTIQAAAKSVAENGRIIYIGSSTTGLPNPGYALHGGSKIAPLYLTQVLAKELGEKRDHCKYHITHSDRRGRYPYCCGCRCSNQSRDTRFLSHGPHGNPGGRC